MQKKCFRWDECRSSKCIKLSSRKLRIHCKVKLKEIESFDTKLHYLKLHILEIQIEVTDFKNSNTWPQGRFFYVSNRENVLSCTLFDRFDEFSKRAISKF